MGVHNLQLKLMTSPAKEFAVFVLEVMQFIAMQEVVENQTGTDGTLRLTFLDTVVRKTWQFSMLNSERFPFRVVIIITLL